MSKGNTKRQPNNQSAKPAAISTPSLQTQLPDWTRGFENASQVFQRTNRALEINVDSDFLKALISTIPNDKAAEFGRWLQQFAHVSATLLDCQQQLEAEYKDRWERCNAEGQAVAADKNDLMDQQAALKQLQSDVETRQTTLDAELSDLAQRSSEMLTLARELELREQNADSGFTHQNANSLEKLKAEQADITEHHQQQIRQLKAEQAELEHQIITARVTLSDTELQRTKDLDERAQALEARDFKHQQKRRELKNARAELKLEQDTLAKEQASYRNELELAHEFERRAIESDRKTIEDELNAERQRLDREWQDLDEARDNFGGRLDHAMELERAAHQRETERLSSRLNDTWDQIDHLKSQLGDYAELDNALGDQPPASLLAQLEMLQQDNRQLRQQQAESDSAMLAQDNESLRDRLNDRDTELQQLRPELEQLKQENARRRTAAVELTGVEQQRRLLEQTNNTLKLNIDDLESRIDQLSDAHKTRTPFPAMSAMDESRDYQRPAELDDVPDLAGFAEELQHRIAQAETVPLYYPLEEVQVLLAGLAMSQLHVFQGISGTGKTSLAKAFAKAMGGCCTDIAVQAGWRDRADLLGHYNAFEQRFYEGDCLQALYQASTPRWQDCCNVILLDEMNLSRPEQYFAEFLSALEKNDPAQRLINLSEHALPNAPDNLVEGRKIQLPDNVWFIGTANHDETTNELADKTYDRAHVMTLPKQDIDFKIRTYENARFSFQSLIAAFDNAEKRHRDTVNSLLKKLTRHPITELLETRFELGWGNRFERQTRRFIPVMIACGGSVGDGLDHLLATRMMRQGKVTGRYDIDKTAIDALIDTLNDFWASGELAGSPEKSLALLERDLQRKESGL